MTSEPRPLDAVLTEIEVRHLRYFVAAAEGFAFWPGGAATGNAGCNQPFVPNPVSKPVHSPYHWLK